jgi:hypothetical protein
VIPPGATLIFVMELVSAGAAGGSRVGQRESSPKP